MRRIIATAVLACVAAGVSAVPALAHGGMEQDDLTIVTGFANEPAYTGQPNAVQLQISHGGEAVADLGPGDLAITVSFGGQSTELALEPQFEVGGWGDPGDYRAAFIPSQPGRYTFDIEGAVDGERVDYSMTSGPKTFSEVQDTTSAMFPAQNAPSAPELATRIEQDAARASFEIASANEAAESARTFAIAAAVVAVVAVGVAVVGLRRGRSAAA